MLIKDVLNNTQLILEKIINGKYVMQDDILYRSTGFNELLEILTKKGFSPNSADNHKPRSERRDSVIYDFQAEKERLKDISYKDAQKRRKLKLPKNKIRGYFKSFSRSLNDFLSINFANRENKVIIAFYKEPLKNLRGAKLIPLGWLINHYDNYELSGDSYISTKNELEDRLYYNGDFLPFNSEELSKYIKAVYVNPAAITPDRYEQFKKIITILRNENIDIRYMGPNTNFDNLTHLALRRSLSSKKTVADKPAREAPDKETNSKEYDKWLKKKKKLDNIKKDIESSSSLEYL